MSANPLFLDDEFPLEFEKQAMPVMLSDNPESWQREVASEIYKQLPYVGNYATNVVVEKVNPERGYGFGSAQVRAKSDAPDQEQESLPSVRVPLIIRDRQLQPLDVFMDGEKVYPLSEDRLNEHLFRTATFETSTRKPEDRGMADQLYPPSRSNYGNSVQGSGEGLMGKFASAEDNLRDMIMAQQDRLVEGIKGGKSFFEAKAGMKKTAGEDPMSYARRLQAEGNVIKDAGMGADCPPSKPKGKTKMGGSLLEAISHTIPQQEIDTFINFVMESPMLKVAALRNPAFESVLLKIAGFKNVGPEKTAAAMVQNIKPDVVQLQKLGSGDFKLRWANTGAYRPLEEIVKAAEAEELAGGPQIQAMGPGATVTLSTNTAQKTDLETDKIEVAKDFGFYQAWDAETNEPVSGWVMQIMDVAMHPLDLYLFVTEDGQRYSVQDSIAGIQMQREASSLAQLSAGGAAPGGDGAFMTKGHQPMVIGPFTITSGASGPEGGQELHAQNVFGEECTLLPTPGIEAIQDMGDGSSYAMPADLAWLPLQGQPMMLVASPLDVENVQDGQQAPGAVDVGSTGQDEFSMDGPPVEKLAATERRFIKRAQAEFLLVGMGLNPFVAREVLGRAEQGEKVKVAGLRPITPLASLHAEMTKKASALLEQFPYHLRRDMTKEAAALEDSETADKILAMNFINPENISTFASYLPDLDETSSKLAEILVASRLGLQQIPEGAVQSSLRNLEEVIGGVKQLQQKELI